MRKYKFKIWVCYTLLRCWAVCHPFKVSHTWSSGIPHTKPMIAHGNNFVCLLID